MTAEAWKRKTYLRLRKLSPRHNRREKYARYERKDFGTRKSSRIEPPIKGAREARFYYRHRIDTRGIMPSCISRSRVERARHVPIYDYCTPRNERPSNFPVKISRESRSSVRRIALIHVRARFKLAGSSSFRVNGIKISSALPKLNI